MELKGNVKLENSHLKTSDGMQFSSRLYFNLKVERECNSRNSREENRAQKLLTKSSQKNSKFSTRKIDIICILSLSSTWCRSHN